MSEHAECADAIRARNHAEACRECQVKAFVRGIQVSISPPSTMDPDVGETFIELAGHVLALAKDSHPPMDFRPVLEAIAWRIARLERRAEKAGKGARCRCGKKKGHKSRHRKGYKSRHRKTRSAR